MAKRKFSYAEKKAYNMGLGAGLSGASADNVSYICDELQKHKKSDKIKWVLTGIGFLLVFVMLTGICLQLFGTGKVKPSEWFKPSDTEQINIDIGGETEIDETSETAALPVAAPLSMVQSVAVYSDNLVLEDLDIPAFLVPPYNGSSVVTDITVVVDCDVAGYDDIYFLNNLLIRKSSYYNSGSGGTVTSYAAVFIPPVIYGYEFVGANFSCKYKDNNNYDRDGVFSFKLADSGDYYYSAVVSRLSSELTLRLEYNELPKATVPLPDDPVKEGYTFVGWYYDEAFTQPYAGAPIYEDTQLFAKFEINHYIVTFNSDGGNEIESVIVDWNTTISPGTSEKRGYKFTGWYYGDGTKYDGQPIKDNITLTAHWDVIMCTVTFIVDGEVYLTKTVEYGTAFSQIVELANTLSLRVLSFSADKEQSVTDGVVVDDGITVNAVEMDGIDKVVNGAKNNKWQIVGGVAAGVAIIAVIAAIAGNVKSKKKS